MSERVHTRPTSILLSTYHQLSLTVESANIRISGLFKPNPYLQLVIDDKVSRKTEVIKNTLHPKWNEDFTVLVTPLTQLLFRLADHHSFRKDNIIGEKKVNLLKLLLLFDGKLDDVELIIDLMKSTSQENVSASNGEVKAAELVILLDGLRIDPSTLSQSNEVFGESATSRDLLHEGVRATIRMSNNPESARSLIRVHQNLRPPPGPPPMSNGAIQHGDRVMGAGLPFSVAESMAGLQHQESSLATEPATIHQSATSPSTSGEDPLPPGWEMRYDVYGRRSDYEHSKEQESKVEISDNEDEILDVSPPKKSKPRQPSKPAAAKTEAKKKTIGSSAKAGPSSAADDLFGGELLVEAKKHPHPLWSSLSRRVGAGVNRQANLIEEGDIFFDIKVYNTADIINLRSEDRLDKWVANLRMRVTHTHR